MKKLAFCLLLACGLPAQAADLGVVINVGAPDYYGVIEAPQPVVVYEQPVIVRREAYVEQPIYLRVPPGHIKHWEKHCAGYHACNRPVYFVRDDWYTNTYAPTVYVREEHHGRGRHHGKGHH